MSALRQALLLTAVFAAIPLIENGIRHTPEGAELTLIAGERELGLADTGPGIPPGEYGNATPADASPGQEPRHGRRGLGLSLVKTIAELHGAELVLSENPRSDAPGLVARAVFPEKNLKLTNL